MQQAVFAGEDRPCFPSPASDQWVPFSDFLGHYAENDSAREPREVHWLRRDVLESFVGVMAMVAACAMTPGVYLQLTARQHRGATPDAAAATITGWVSR